MVEKRSKFAALADLREEQQVTDLVTAIAESDIAPAEAAKPVGQGRGRPPGGKRSNPEFKMYTHYLKRKTQRAAVAKLMAQDDGRDLSDVLQELLDAWVKE